MHTVFVIALIVAGALAASSLILSKAPDAKPLFDKVGAFAGWIGVVLLVISIIYAIKYVLPHLGTFLTSFGGLVGLSTVVVGALLGFLQGFGLIASWIGGKGQEAVEKAAQLRTRLTGVQVPLGLAGIALGIYALV